MGQRWSSRSGSRKDGLLRNDIAVSAKLQEFYPSLAAALKNGSSTRPGLPIELVSYIMRLADCVLLSMLSRVSREPFVLDSWSSQQHVQPCILTDPVSRGMIHNLAKLRLTTSSHDQGWCSERQRGSWSWFEITLVERCPKDELRVKMTPVRGNTEGNSALPEISRSASPLLFAPCAPDLTLQPRTAESATSTDDGVSLRPLSWISHYNQICSTDFVIHEGAEFGPDHEIWQHIAEGDRILVRAYTQYGGWKNFVEWSTLRLWEWYNPISQG